MLRTPATLLGFALGTLGAAAADLQGKDGKFDNPQTEARGALAVAHRASRSRTAPGPTVTCHRKAADACPVSQLSTNARVVSLRG